MNTNVDQMLTERGARYGEFENLAEISQGLKQIMKNAPSWCDMSHAQREALDMVCNKLGRILNGDPAYKDSWDDLIGYLTLAANTLDA